jgi:hypothetical protein
MKGIIMLKKNVGTMDRLVRICIGIALIAMVFLPPNIAWGWIGLVPLVTGILGSCPLYGLIGIETSRLE